MTSAHNVTLAADKDKADEARRHMTTVQQGPATAHAQCWTRQHMVETRHSGPRESGRAHLPDQSWLAPNEWRSMPNFECTNRLHHDHALITSFIGYYSLAIQCAKVDAEPAELLAMNGLRPPATERTTPSIRPTAFFTAGLGPLAGFNERRISGTACPAGTQRSFTVPYERRDYCAKAPALKPRLVRPACGWGIRKPCASSVLEDYDSPIASAVWARQLEILTRLRDPGPTVTNPSLTSACDQGATSCLPLSLVWPGPRRQPFRRDIET
jgi:hypothetical protein